MRACVCAYVRPSVCVCIRACLWCVESICVRVWHILSNFLVEEIEAFRIYGETGRSNYVFTPPLVNNLRPLF